MKYLFLMLFLVSCSTTNNAPKIITVHTDRLTKEERCKKQSTLQCLDNEEGGGDEGEKTFCEEGAYKECMEHND